jgi:4-hydroxybenzoate polyprenyltransferase
MVLSALLLLSALVLSAIGAIVAFSGHEEKWLDTIVTWIGNAFLFTAGIAVGKGGKDVPPQQN